MKTVILEIYRFTILAIMICIFNGNAIAAAIDVSFEKIPVNSPVPIITEIPDLEFILPVIPSCNETFPDPELFFTGKTERTVNGIEYIGYSLVINNKDDYPDYLFNKSPSLPPCGLNTSASRTWALIYDHNDDYL